MVWIYPIDYASGPSDVIRSLSFRHAMLTFRRSLNELFPFATVGHKFLQLLHIHVSNIYEEGDLSDEGEGGLLHSSCTSDRTRSIVLHSEPLNP